MRIQFLVTPIIVLSLFSFSEAKPNCQQLLPSPEVLTAEINSQTAREVLKQRFHLDTDIEDRSAWVCFQEAIASGDEKWLLTVEVLLEGAYADPSRELIEPLSRALIKNPTGVLRLMSRSQNGLAKPNTVCALAVSGDVDPKTASKTFDQFQNALRVKVPVELHTIQVECRNEIEAARANFFNPPETQNSGDW
ncbi:MAG: hypothetical protein KCHDKBKB_01912 [Elusimicrobia bacterium]|nr:hypothetical protein [Elusimicrobiota bacterium]